MKEKQHTLPRYTQAHKAIVNSLIYDRGFQSRVESELGSPASAVVDWDAGTITVIGPKGGKVIDIDHVLHVRSEEKLQ